MAAPASSVAPWQAINEQRSTHAEALHVSYGLSRYPGYCFRMTPEHVETHVEAVLEAQLQSVREQKAQLVEHLERCAAFMQSDAMAEVRISGDPATVQLREVLHEDLVQATQLPEDCTVADALQACAAEDGGPFGGTKNARLLALVEEATEDGFVFSFPMLTDAFCDRLKAHTMRFAEGVLQAAEAGAGCGPSDGAAAPINLHSSVLHRHALSFMQLDWLNDLLMELVVKHLASAVFSADCGGLLDWRHGYVIGYKAEPGEDGDDGSSANPLLRRSGLVKHTDDSEVTLNVLLTDPSEFEGGQLTMHGVRGTAGEGVEVTRLASEKGQALVHLGRHVHEVSKVTSGERACLIMWTRCLSGVRARTCPCCWMNRREELSDPCVCGPAWNSK